MLDYETLREASPNMTTEIDSFRQQITKIRNENASLTDENAE